MGKGGKTAFLEKHQVNSNNMHTVLKSLMEISAFISLYVIINGVTLNTKSNNTRNKNLILFYDKMKSK